MIKWLIVCLISAATWAQSQTTLDSLATPLLPLKPFLGKTWKGEFANSTAEKPLFDVFRWERALNGQAVRGLHSVNNGLYGGETIYIWDRDKKALVYFYFTTAGFYTQGTMTVSGEHLISEEEVTGNANGITRVRSTAILTPEGTLQVKSEYLQHGQWTSGHAVTYTESPQAEVLFK